MIISVFYDIDNFCKELKTFFERLLLFCNGKGASFEPPLSLSLSEIITICVVLPVWLPDNQMVLYKLYKKGLPQILPETGQL